MSKKILLLFSVLPLLFACHAKKTVEPTLKMEYNDPDAAGQASILNLPIKLSKTELEQTLNAQLGDVLFEDNDFSDGLLIKAKRQSNITLEVADQRVRYRVPINLWVRKDVVLTNVDAEGGLVLEFETAYTVQPDWTLVTKTELKHHEWTKAPVVKLGFGNINVTSIANQFVNQARAELAAAIDDQAKALIDLKGEVKKAWAELQKPVLVSEEYQSWLVMNTDSVKLTPLTTQNDEISCTVVITAHPRLFMGERPPASRPTPMPDFQYIKEPPNRDFALYLGTEVPFAQAERIARQNLLGQSFSYGKKTVKVEGISLQDRGNKLEVITTLSGSYNGDVVMTGKPEYNNRRNEIVLKEVDFDFSTQRTLMKTASWLFKGSLRKSIEENLNFHLAENIEATQKAIETELENFDLGPGIKMVGHLDRLDVSHVYINPTGINLKVGLTGNLGIEIKNFVARR